MIKIQKNMFYDHDDTLSEIKNTNGYSFIVYLLQITKINISTPIQYHLFMKSFHIINDPLMVMLKTKKKK